MQVAEKARHHFNDMKRLLFVFLLAAASCAVSCGNSEDHGNPTISDEPPNNYPKDFDTAASDKKDTLLLPH
jgi:hypothetical protein